MEGFNQCTNGHYYKNNLSECPYCPKPESYTSGFFDKTNENNGANKSVNVFDKTQISINNENNVHSFDKTQISVNDTFSNATEKKATSNTTQINNTPSIMENTTTKSTARDLNKTFIHDHQNSNKEGAVELIREARKLTGWIVSFTLNPMGQDYRIYEGSNTIGRDTGNTITITSDNAISSKHITILSKNEKYYIRDEMAANGTFVNDEEIEVGRPYELKDGDKIKIGTTVFKFRTSS